MMILRSAVLAVVIETCVSAAAGLAAQPSRYFAIKVIDEQTGRGVPMVELQTTSSVSYYTDSSGRRRVEMGLR